MAQYNRIVVLIVRSVVMMFDTLIEYIIIECEGFQIIHQQYLDDDTDACMVQYVRYVERCVCEMC